MPHGYGTGAAISAGGIPWWGRGGTGLYCTAVHEAVSYFPFFPPRSEMIKILDTDTRLRDKNRRVRPEIPIPDPDRMTSPLFFSPEHQSFAEGLMSADRRRSIADWGPACEGFRPWI